MLFVLRRHQLFFNLEHGPRREIAGMLASPFGSSLLVRADEVIE